MTDDESDFHWVDEILVDRRGAKYIRGWVGKAHEDSPLWYGRTVGTADVPVARAEFETQEEAMDFVLVMAKLGGV